MSIKVQRISRQLEQCQTMAQVYTTREHLLGLPVTNVGQSGLGKNLFFFNH